MKVHKLLLEVKCIGIGTSIGIGISISDTSPIYTTISLAVYSTASDIVVYH